VSPALSALFDLPLPVANFTAVIAIPK